MIEARRSLDMVLISIMITGYFSCLSLGLPFTVISGNCLKLFDQHLPIVIWLWFTLTDCRFTCCLLRFLPLWLQSLCLCYTLILYVRIITTYLGDRFVSQIKHESSWTVSLVTEHQASELCSLVLWHFLDLLHQHLRLAENNAQICS